VLQILEPCQSSVAYQPPNPWTMGILGLLVEIYAMPNLKMNLKFDIEVLALMLLVLLRCGGPYDMKPVGVCFNLFGLSGPVQEPWCGSERCNSNFSTQR
jgi:hypothetical protein